MPLRREVHDPPGPKLTGVVHEHATGLHVAPLARGRVLLEVGRVGVLELQRDPAPHDADAVDRVHEGLRVGLEDVSLRVFDHSHDQKYQRGTTSTGGWWA